MVWWKSVLNYSEGTLEPVFYKRAVKLANKGGTAEVNLSSLTGMKGYIFYLCHY